MKRKIFVLPLLASILLIINSCSTDFEVAAPYKEIPIVFGVLNKNDMIHYIKVNKAYLNKEGSAYLAGSVSDSNLFPYPLTVKLYAYNGATIIDSVQLDTVHVPKTGGSFVTNDIVYATPSYKLKYTNATGSDTIWARYDVVVRRSSDSKLIAKARCNVISDVRFNRAPNEINLYNNQVVTPTNPEYRNQIIQWYASRSGRRYSAQLIFRFRVVNDALGVNYNDSVIMQMFSNNRLTTNNGANTQINYTLSGRAFYQNLQNALDPLPFGYRREYIAPLEFQVEFAGTELDTYMELNNSTVSLSDVVPEYTNVEGGLGVFSSRVRTVFNDGRQTGLSLGSIDGLKRNSIVGRAAGANDLGFY